MLLVNCIDFWLKKYSCETQKNKLPKQPKKNHYYRTHVKCYKSNNTTDLIWFDFFFFCAGKKRYPALYDEHIIILTSSKCTARANVKNYIIFLNWHLPLTNQRDLRLKNKKAWPLRLLSFDSFELLESWERSDSLISCFTYSFISGEWKDMLIAHKVITNQNLWISRYVKTQKSQIAFTTDQFSNFNVFH